MKLSILFSLFLFIGLNTFAQIPVQPRSALFVKYSFLTWNKEAIERVSSIGKLWGVIKYFHPTMAKGIIDPDSLITGSAEELLNAPSKPNFASAIIKMLGMLHDPCSRITNSNIDHKEASPVLFKNAQGRPLKLSGGATFISVSQELFKNLWNVDSCFTTNISAQNNFIIDLRNLNENEDLGLKQYQNFVQPLVSQIISRNLVLPTNRSAYYYGLPDEDFQDDIDIVPASMKKDPSGRYYVYFGLKNISQGAYISFNQQGKYRDKKFCFIVNRYNDPNTLKALLALRNRNECNLIFDGSMPDYLQGDIYNMVLADNIQVEVKISEAIYEDGSCGYGPDKILPVNEDASLNSNLLKTAISLLTARDTFKARPVENTAFIRLKQKSYADTLFPEKKLRLLGLFNYWNVIHYFSPNKNLITGSWDSTLNYFIPRFLFAKDYKSYYWLLLELNTRINDGHGQVISSKSWIFPPDGTDFYIPLYVKYLEGKTIIVKLGTDSSQADQLKKLKEGDAITAINNIPIHHLYNDWKQYIGSSNENGFYRVLHFMWLLNRPDTIPVKVSIQRKNQTEDIVLKPVSRDLFFKNLLAVHYPPVPLPYWKTFNDSIGYVRINSINSNQLDTIWNDLKKQKYIILDARAYPKDTYIADSIASYFAAKTDTVCIDAYPFVQHPVLRRNSISLEYETITPSIHRKLMDNKKIVILCATGNGSQAEGNIMILQRITKGVTIGTQTAGANGIRTTIVLPGGYSTYFSGYGVYYPDGTPNQKLGVKIDIPVKPTIKGELEGKDEILERAIKFIQTKK